MQDEFCPTCGRKIPQPSSRAKVMVALNKALDLARMANVEVEENSFEEYLIGEICKALGIDFPGADDEKDDQNSHVL